MGPISTFWGVAGLIAGVALSSATWATYDHFIDDPHVIAETKAGMVSLSIATAAKARADELQRQVTAGEQVIVAYQSTLKSLRETAARQDIETRNATDAYEKKLADTNRRCALDSNDIDFLRDRAGSPDSEVKRGPR